MQNYRGSSASEHYISIQQIYTKIQHACKGYPYNIRNHKVSGFRLYFVELNSCCNNQHPQNYNPYKCEQIILEGEKNKAPCKIKKQLYVVERLCKFLALCVGGYVNKICGNSHKHVKYCPRYGKSPPGGHKEGLDCRQVEFFHTATGEKARNQSHTQGDCKVFNKLFKIDLHYH